MNADEIVKKLRLRANTFSTTPECDKTLMEESADLIESLQAQLASSEIPCCECGGEVVEFTVPNDIWNSVMRPDGHETDREYLCFDCWYKALRQWMHGMQRREKAAVEDLKLHGGCPSCAHRIGNPPHCPCKKFVMDNQSAYIRCLAYEWRGPQDEKGESNA